MIITIIAVIIVLLFLAVLFLVTILHSSNKRKQLEKEKAALKESIEKQLLMAQLEMQEQTFNIISQEIHDNVGQTLTLAKVQLAILEQNHGSLLQLPLSDLRAT